MSATIPPVGFKEALRDSKLHLSRWYRQHILVMTVLAFVGLAFGIYKDVQLSRAQARFEKTVVYRTVLMHENGDIEDGAFSALDTGPRQDFFASNLDTQLARLADACYSLRQETVIEDRLTCQAALSDGLTQQWVAEGNDSKDGKGGEAEMVHHATRVDATNFYFEPFKRRPVRHTTAVPLVFDTDGEAFSTTVYGLWANYHKVRAQWPQVRVVFQWQFLTDKEYAEKVEKDGRFEGRNPMRLRLVRRDIYIEEQ